MENNEYLKRIIKKVIIENQEIGEGILQTLFSTGKELTPAMKGALKDVVTVGKAAGDPILIGIKDAKTGKIVERGAQTYNELANALKNNRVNANELARLESGLLKAKTPVDPAVTTELVKSLVSSERFVKEYALLSGKELENALRSKKYSEQSIKEILNVTKTDKNYQAAVRKYKKDTGVTGAKKATPKKGTAKQTGTGATATAKTGDINITINNTAPFAGEKVITNVDDAAKARVEATNGAKAAGDTKAADVIDDAIRQTENLTQNALNKLNDVRKISKVQKVLYGLAAVAGGYMVYRFLFGPNTEPESPQYNVLPKCVLDLLDDDGVQADTTADGIIRVRVTKTGNPEYDKVGGLIFNNDGTVQLADGSRTGTYKCKEVAGETQIVSEPLQEIKLRFSEILNYGNKNILSEATEVTTQEMTNYVDTAVSDLDGWVDNENLTSLKNILTKLKGKTYKGKNALSEFLRFYSADEGGDDFVADVNSVGVKTLGVQGIELKDEILRMFAAVEVKREGDGKQTGLGGIEITWNDNRQEPPPPKPIKNDEFKDCFNFPITPGCIASPVYEVQKCYYDKKEYRGKIDAMYTNEFKGLLEYIHKKLGIKSEFKNELSKEFYNLIMQDCKKQTPVVTQTVTPTAEVQPIIVPPVTPPAPPTEPVYDLNRLNELLASRYLVKKRNGTIVKWKGPELAGNDYYILNKYLADQGYEQKKSREIGDKDDEDVEMKYKWKLKSEK